LRDGQRDRRVKLLPQGAADPHLSDDGRYVTYTLPGPKANKSDTVGPLRRDVRVYDRKTGRTRSAATTRSGRSLKPTWRNTCAPDWCDEEAPISRIPQLTGGQISGNGRYIVFCANYARPDRADLYIKDWRTKHLQRIDGACQTHSPVADWDSIQPPSINEDGTVILLPGRHSEGDDSDGCWEPSHALVNRSRMVQVGGRYPTMTHDGRLISSVGPNRGCDHDESGATYDAFQVHWFDLNTMSVADSDVPGLKLTPTNSSRRGRFVTWYQDTYAGPEGYINQQWLVMDRATGTRYDLGAALRDAGYSPSPCGNGTRGDDATVDYPIISRDGRTLFVNTDQGWVSVHWARPE
jgi:hypothetical protein